MKEIIKKRCIYGGVSFVELMEIVGEGAKGNFEISLAPNIVIWSGVSEEFADSIRDLIKNKDIKVTPTSILIYSIDGIQLNLPIAKRAIKYKKPHWLPVIFSREA